MTAYPRNTTAQAAFRLSNPLYEEKRRALLSRSGSSTAQCGPFTKAFVQAFPELRRVPGFYRCASGHSAGQHWWLIDLEGRIVDPTADQFDDAGAGTYEAYCPHKHKLPKGKCMCCGMEKYASEGCGPCSEECDRTLAEEYETRLSGGPYEEHHEDAQTDAELMARGLKFAQMAALLESLPLSETAEPACA
jgi:hypothetical protein